MWEQGDVDGLALAAEHCALTLRHLGIGAVKLVLVGGLPGSGKSTVAGGLADRLGMTVLGTDRLRKESAGLGPGRRGDPALYAPRRVADIYDALLARAESLLAQGESVVLDATWGAAASRAKALAMAERVGADAVQLRCAVSERLMELRLGARSDDWSDADIQVARTLARVAEPWPEAIELNTELRVAESVARAAESTRPPAAERVFTRRTLPDPYGTRTGPFGPGRGPGRPVARPWNAAASTVKGRRAVMSETAGTHRPDIRVLARNVRDRRRACSLSVPEVADRSGTAIAWVESVERGTASWSISSLSRLALALDTSLNRLISADYDPSESAPEVGARAEATRELADMDEAECYARLALHSVGRVSPGDGPEPFVLPVNYVLDRRDIVFRTKPGSLPSTVAGRAAFEVDELLQPGRLGWSVLIIGDTQRVTDESELERLEATGLTPWAGGDRPVWIRIRPDRVTGRRIAPRGGNA